MIQIKHQVQIGNTWLRGRSRWTLKWLSLIKIRSFWKRISIIYIMLYSCCLEIFLMTYQSSFLLHVSAGFVHWIGKRGNCRVFGLKRLCTYLTVYRTQISFSQTQDFFFLLFFFWIHKAYIFLNVLLPSSSTKE